MKDNARLVLSYLNFEQIPQLTCLALKMLKEMLFHISHAS